MRPRCLIHSYIHVQPWQPGLVPGSHRREGSDSRAAPAPAVKRRGLISHPESRGCEFLREGANHSVYVNRGARETSTVPRHREVDDLLVRKLYRNLQVPRTVTRNTRVKVAAPFLERRIASVRNQPVRCSSTPEPLGSTWALS
jgi:mRNA interferase HicA